MNEYLAVSCDINLGDSVISRKTGLPACGQVISVAHPYFFMKIRNITLVQDKDFRTIVVNRSTRQEEFKTWTDLYPEWFNQPVIYIRYSTPQKNCSFEEFNKSLFPEEQEFPKEIRETMYRLRVPEVNEVCFPIDDLEKI